MTKANEFTRNVMIELCSTHSEVSPDDEEIESAKVEEADKLDMTSEGCIRVVDNRVEIEYFESELTGMEGSCTCISFERDNPGIVSMIRTGTVVTALVFEEGKRHICAYNTEFMAFEVCVYTSKVDNRMTEHGGELMLDYSIEFRGATTEQTIVKMKVTPIEK